MLIFQNGWKNQLTGIRLPQLIAELEAVHQPQSAVSLAELLGSDLDDVLAVGLSGLNPDQQRTLLTNPSVLFELQERILTDGSQYWLDRSTGSSESEPITDHRSQLAGDSRFHLSAGRSIGCHNRTHSAIGVLVSSTTVRQHGNRCGRAHCHLPAGTTRSAND